MREAPHREATDPTRDRPEPVELSVPLPVFVIKSDPEPENSTEFQPPPNALATPSMIEAATPIITTDNGLTLAKTKILDLTLHEALRIKIDYVGICTVSVSGDLMISIDKVPHAPAAALEINMAIPEDTYFLIQGTQGTLTVSDPR